MHRNTSSEFMEWKVFLEEEERKTSKQDLYLAQIAAEIRRFLLALCSKDSKAVNVQDFLIQFGDSPAVPQQAVSSKQSPARIECGPEAVKDPKWAAVNAKAKTAWAARLGRPIP